MFYPMFDPISSTSAMDQPLADWYFFASAHGFIMIYHDCIKVYSFDCNSLMGEVLLILSNIM